MFNKECRIAISRLEDRIENLRHEVDLNYVFKPGDCVESLRKRGELDIVVSVPGMRAYDMILSALQGFELKNSGWEFRKNWKLVTSAPVPTLDEVHALRRDLDLLMKHLGVEIKHEQQDEWVIKAVGKKQSKR